MKIGDTVEIVVTNRSVCVCGSWNVGKKFNAVFVGVINSDFGTGLRFDPIDFICDGCGRPVTEHIEWNTGAAVDEMTALRSAELQ